ncbi:MAG: DUF481 domain-containing protein [Gammaproteobacteria bacterium]|nr:DUF481 domain-containing protein [Gammaproteobacteria bacterium]
MSYIASTDFRDKTMYAFDLHRVQRILYLGTLLLLSLFLVKPSAAAEDGHLLENFMIRLVSYSVENADTDMTVLSDDNIGTGFSYADDLGGDTRTIVPRLDMYYRFNDRHRIEFSNFKYERDGRQLLAIDIDIEDQTYSIGETVVSDITYELLKIGYAYSFYHSTEVELSFTAGLNITSYDFNFELADGSQADSSRVNAPMPMFGLRMSYAINPRWSVHYLAETFFIEVGDSLEGAFLAYELDLQYRFSNNFTLGFGVSRFSMDLDANDDDWNGKIADSHRGVLLFASYYI